MLLRALCLIAALAACQRDPEPEPAPPVAQTWWQGDWQLDLARMPLSDAPDPAADVVRALGASATYALTPSTLVRRIADAEDTQPWTVKSGDRERMEFDAGGTPLAVERRQDGVWLVDGAIELPLTRPGAG